MRIVLLQNVQDDSGDVSDANITNESRSHAASKSGGAADHDRLSRGQSLSIKKMLVWRKLSL
jgi:hypothetical protein